MTQLLLSINIPFDPNIASFGGLLVTWHGVFTAIGIVVGVWLAARIGSSDRVGIDPDTAYTLGMIVVACGIVGARLLYVMERYGDSSTLDSPLEIIKINEGGISIYGAIIGGAIGGWAYGLKKRLPAAAGADAAVFGMLAGLAIGRVGDIINGEHYAKTTDLPWGVTYSHPDSPGFFRDPQHPAVIYEMIGDIAIMGILAFAWRMRLKPGVIFCLAFILYAIMRFFVSFLRLDSKEPLLGLSTPQLVSIVVVIVLTPLLLYFMRRPQQEVRRMPSAAERSRLAMSRAERRRRLRTGP
jgi:phosphatidylglycerol---prolipoprotein diacylglyceryl transferase